MKIPFSAIMTLKDKQLPQFLVYTIGPEDRGSDCKDATNIQMTCTHILIETQYCSSASTETEKVQSRSSPLLQSG